MRRLLHAFMLMGAASTSAHEWDRPHKDVYLTPSEAAHIGIVVQSESIEWTDKYGLHGSKGSKVTAIQNSAAFPPMIENERLIGGDFDFSCGGLEGDVDVEQNEAETGFLRYILIRVTTAECQSMYQIWAIYSGTSQKTFYWVSPSK